MGAPDLLYGLRAIGVNLTARGDKLIATPKNLINPEIAGLIRQHKPELLEALTSEQLPQDVQRRRDRLLEMLHENPEARLAVLTDTESDPDYVIVAVALRNIGTGEVLIHRTRYDPFRLMNLIDKYAGMH